MNFVEMGKSLLKHLVLGIDLENIADPSNFLAQAPAVCFGDLCLFIDYKSCYDLLLPLAADFCFLRIDLKSHTKEERGYFGD